MPAMNLSRAACPLRFATQIQLLFSLRVSVSLRRSRCLLCRAVDAAALRAARAPGLPPVPPSWQRIATLPMQSEAAVSLPAAKQKSAEPVPSA